MSSSSSLSAPLNVRTGNSRARARLLVSLAAPAAAGSLLTTAAQADGTAAINNMNGDRIWTAPNIWTWTGDTGAQVYPGDGKGPGAGTEAAIVRPIGGGRTLNVPATNTAALTIGSFTLEQTQ